MIPLHFPLSFLSFKLKDSSVKQHNTISISAKSFLLIVPSFSSKNSFHTQVFCFFAFFLLCTQNLIQNLYQEIHLSYKIYLYKISLTFAYLQSFCYLQFHSKSICIHCYNFWSFSTSLLKILPPSFPVKIPTKISTI